MENEIRERLNAIGLDQKTIDNTIKGKAALQSLIETLNVDNVHKCDKKVTFSISQNFRLATFFTLYLKKSTTSHRQPNGGLNSLTSSLNRRLLLSFSLTTHLNSLKSTSSSQSSTSLSLKHSVESVSSLPKRM